MNFLELVQGVCVETDFPVPTVWSECVELHHTKIKMNINNVLTMVCASIVDKWKFLEETYAYTTVVNNNSISIPAYMGTVRNVEILNITTDKYHELNFSQNVERITQNTSTGTPNSYTVYEGKILISPIPDDTFSLKIHYYSDYFARASSLDIVGKKKLTLHTDVPKIPDKFHEVLVFGGAMYYIGKVDDPQYQHTKQLFDDAYRNLRGEWKRSKEDFQRINIGKSPRNSFKDVQKDFFSQRF